MGGLDHVSGASQSSRTDPWHATACILCSVNCGVEVRTDDRAILRVRGDKAHPSSRGYLCEKALRLNHYQHGRHRLTTPLRRRRDGGFDQITWDTAIREVADRFQEIVSDHGPASLLYYGGGGQGNHLGGAYGSATRNALGIRYTSNALAQEKTGEFWVDGQLFGRESCHTTGDYEHAQVAVFWGKNPWQSHGFPQARRVLREIANDPERSLIVVDPRRSETARLADIHLRPKPGGDAYLLAALLAVLVEEDHLAHRWLTRHAAGLDDVVQHLGRIHIGRACARAGVDQADVRLVARRIGRVNGGVAIFEDLGLQQSPHSTLNSYLEKLIVLLTGNLGRRGGMNLHSRFANLGGGHAASNMSSERTTPVTKHRLVAGLVPCNVIADEILTDSLDRFRAVLVESANPCHTIADSKRMRDAARALELLVVIDVAMTETAREAHYVLPAASQFEKWECTFFATEFPRNVLHVRPPLFSPLRGTLPEYEIHARLCRSLGAYDDEEIDPLRDAAKRGRRQYAEVIWPFVAERPHLRKVLPVLLYETLGPTLRTLDGIDAAGTAALWGLSHRCARQYAASVRRAGIDGDDADLGDALFEPLLANRSGMVFTVDDYEETLRRIATDDGRVSLAIPPLLKELDRLDDEPGPGERRTDYPFILSAGERRSSTANTVMRDPTWRRHDAQGRLHLAPADADALGIAGGDEVRVTTPTGSALTIVQVDDSLMPGHISLPNGFGLVDDETGTRVGVATNELTRSSDRDWFAGTPHHKHVPARLEVVEAHHSNTTVVLPAT